MRRALLLLIIGACGTSSNEPVPNATLADLGPIHLGLQFGGTDDVGRSGASVDVGYDTHAFQDQHGECAILDPSVTAHINGIALSFLWQGGDTDFRSCLTPTLSVDDADLSGVASVDLADATVQITAEYPVDAFERRIATLRSTDSWSFHVGQQVAVGWSHPGDELVSGNVNYPIYFSVEGIENALRIVPTIVGEEVSFTIPSPGRYVGDGRISFDFATTEGTATTCSGAKSCTYWAAHQFMHTARIDP